MITHLVFFKLKDRSPEQIAAAVSVLKDMEGRIDGLLSLEVGADIVRSPRSYDIALVAKFASMEALSAYQVHPVHQKVVAYMNQVGESSASVDYES